MPPDFDMVLFGATGDLSMRKLLPALYQAHAAGELHPNGRIIALGRSDLDTAGFIAKADAEAKIHIKTAFDEAQWAAFTRRIVYLRLDITRRADFDALAQTVQRRQAQSVVVYLSTAPEFFADACANLAAVGLNTPQVRIVLEKPLGTDLSSARAISEAVGRHFGENQIYRIDHYLGKESLQNLLPLRFGNTVFEPLWNRDYVRSVEITAAETLGVEERGGFYDGAGALRDMLQNHIMQMLCYTAMEAPAAADAQGIHAAKLALLQSLKPMSRDDAAAGSVRGQYAAQGSLKGYRQESKVPPESRTETFAALRLEIDNPRWAGVPFYLRTGKRMAERSARIVLNFKAAAGAFGGSANRLLISLQPQETVSLSLQVKAPGSSKTTAAEMTLDLAQAAAGRRADAYELLLREVIAGRQELFVRRDEAETVWAWLEPLLQNWAADSVPLYDYPAGSWGPQAADELPARDGNRWSEAA